VDPLDKRQTFGGTSLEIVTSPFFSAARQLRSATVLRLGGPINRISGEKFGRFRRAVGNGAPRLQECGRSAGHVTSDHLSRCTVRRSQRGAFVYHRVGHQPQMRYYFNLVRAREIISDQVGIELADFDRVPAHVLEAIVFKALAELREEDGELANQCRSWMVEVRDVSSGVVLVIDLSTFDRLTLLAIALRTSDKLSIFQDLGTFC
jgi:Domain of unknown function (DUF6894)